MARSGVGANWQRLRHIPSCNDARALGSGDFRCLHVARLSRCLHGTNGKQVGVDLPDLRNSLRLPITLLVAATARGRILPAIIRPDRHSAVPQLFRREVIMIGAPTLEIAVLLLGPVAPARSVRRENRNGADSPSRRSLGLIVILARELLPRACASRSSHRRFLEFLRR